MRNTRYRSLSKACSACGGKGSGRQACNTYASRRAKHDEEHHEQQRNRSLVTYSLGWEGVRRHVCISNGLLPRASMHSAML
jgi:hypothetical protein